MTRPAYIKFCNLPWVCWGFSASEESAQVVGHWMRRRVSAWNIPLCAVLSSPFSAKINQNRKQKRIYNDIHCFKMQTTWKEWETIERKELQQSSSMTPTHHDQTEDCYPEFFDKQSKNPTACYHSCLEVGMFSFPVRTVYRNSRFQTWHCFVLTFFAPAYFPPTKLS